jgi:hypothetical protein
MNEKTLSPSDISGDHYAPLHARITGVWQLGIKEAMRFFSAEAPESDTDGHGYTNRRRMVTQTFVVTHRGDTWEEPDLESLALATGYALNTVRARILKAEYLGQDCAIIGEYVVDLEV